MKGAHARFSWLRHDFKLGLEEAAEVEENGDVEVVLGYPYLFTVLGGCYDIDWQEHKLCRCNISQVLMWPGAYHQLFIGSNYPYNEIII